MPKLDFQRVQNTMNIPESESNRAQRIARKVVQQILYLKSRAENATGPIEQGIVSEQLRDLDRVQRDMYFGGVEFRLGGKEELYLVGQTHFDGKDPGDIIVSPWSHIGGLYYEALGNNDLLLPSQFVGEDANQEHVNLFRKRNYTFAEGRLKSFSYEGAPLVENGAKVVSWNDRLLEALSGSSSRTMRSMVATIQEEQNKVIRDEKNDVLVVCGVAGSGKTAVALHRVSYLLYNHAKQGDLTERQILVISPNNGLSEYMSRVLPGLGNDGVAQWTMDDLAKEWLSLLRIRNVDFEDQREFAGRVASPISNETKEDIRWKLSVEVADSFLPWINEYVTRKYFASVRYADIPMLALSTYQEYLQYQQRPVKTIPSAKERLSQVDLWPILCLSAKFSNLAQDVPYTPPDAFAFGSIKHLVVDEMQDLSPFQYSFLKDVVAAKDCRWTILGDENQTINNLLPKITKTLGFIFDQTYMATLNTCYRSSKEIMEFAAKLVPCDDVLFADRHTSPPEDLEFASEAEMLADLQAKICTERPRYEQSGFLAIVCKTDTQAQNLSQALSSWGARIPLLGRDPMPESGVVIASVRVAKGREFDSVIVPYAKNLCSNESLDRRLLYVAATRAMHQLSILSISDLPENRISESVFATPSPFRFCPNCGKWVSQNNMSHARTHQRAGNANGTNRPQENLSVTKPRVSGNPAREDTISASTDATTGYHVIRDNGRFGSLPSFDRFDDESRP